MNIIIEEIVSEFPVVITEEVVQIEIFDVVSYFDLVETYDTDFVGKDGYVPTVDENSGKLVLREPTSGSGGSPSGNAGGDLGGTYPNPTVPALADKVDKVSGKSLILDTEITRLATVDNFDNSGNVATLANKVDKVSGSRLITSAESVILGGQSGTNTGDQDLSGLMVKTNNLSDLTSPQNARANIGLDKRTTFGNANYSALITDRQIVTSATFTAPRTVTLIDGLNAGAEIIISDEFQTITTTNTLTIAVPSGKKLNGVTNGTIVMKTAGSFRRFFCDGSGNYIYDSGMVRANDPTFTGDLRGATNSSIGFTLGAQLSSPADGVISLFTSTFSSGSRYTLGLATASNPAITKDGNDMAITNGNNSSDRNLRIAGLQTAYVAKTATYTAGATDSTINCTANTFTITLPTAVGIAGKIYTIVNSGAGTITIATTSSQTFSNVTATPTTLTMATVGTRVLQSNGTNWMLISSL